MSCVHWRIVVISTRGVFIFWLLGMDAEWFLAFILRRFLRDMHLQNSVLKCGLNFVDAGIRRQDEPLNECSTRALGPQTASAVAQNRAHAGEIERIPMQTEVDFLLSQPVEIEFV